MYPNSEQNPQACAEQELNKLKFPADQYSLYHNRFYDNQVANNKCHIYPQGIVEGFNSTWNSIIKWFIIILLVIIFIALMIDFFAPKKTMTLNVDTPSEFIVTEVQRV